MKFGSLFAGIGGFDLGFERAGMECAWQSEIDPFCNRVLARHWPAVSRYGDIRELRGEDLEPVDLICGGFPCQDVSVAGRRVGLVGERSSLFFEFARIAEEMRPRWLVVENVPGLLSSNGGRDFGTVLGTLAELGYGVAYRILDAQYFGVPQRRRRVFVVGCLGDWRRAAEVLFEPESGAGYPPPSREERQVVASLLASGAGTNRPAGVASEPDFLVAHALTSGRSGMRFDPTEEDYVINAQALGTSQVGLVRRLTPRECERLQGFPDDWTFVPNTKLVMSFFNQKHDEEVMNRFRKAVEEGNWDNIYQIVKDSPRYRVLGNAVAVPVAEWIGRRILVVEDAST